MVTCRSRGLTSKKRKSHDGLDPICERKGLRLKRRREREIYENGEGWHDVAALSDYTLLAPNGFALFKNLVNYIILDDENWRNNFCNNKKS